MEIIRKKICLEPSRNRYYNNKPTTQTIAEKNATSSGIVSVNKTYYYENNIFYNDNLSFGGECVDLIIKNYGYKVNVKSKYSWATTLYLTEGATLRVPLMRCDINGNKITLSNGKKYININGVKTEYTDNGYFLLRYKNMMKYYHWVINTFIPSCSFYQICKGRFKTTALTFNTKIESTSKTSYFFSDYNIGIYAELPDITLVQDKTNTVICVTSLKDEITKRFGTLELMGDFIIFCNYYFNHGFFSEKNRMGVETNVLVRAMNAVPCVLSYIPPFITVPVVLTQDTLDIGVNTPVVETWIPKKKYYLGDVVYYNGETYLLNICDKFEFSCIDSRFDNVINMSATTDKNKIAKNDYSKNYIIMDWKGLTSLYKFCYFDGVGSKAKTNVYVFSTGTVGSWRLILPYHTGVFNTDTKITSFSENYWKKIEHECFNTSNTSNGVAYTSVVESRLSDYRRPKSSVDDNGGVLPFIVHYDNGKPTTDTELEFMVGVTNEVKNDDLSISRDGIEKISIYQDEKLVNEFKIENEIILKSKFPNITGNIIEFVYYGNRRGFYLSNKFYPIASGITYSEKYYYSADTVKDVTIDGNKIASIDFININFTYSLLNSGENDDVKTITDNPIYSTATIDKNDIEKGTTNFAPTYKEESLLGVTNINETIDARVSRGISAAFERHHILGEIKTMQDLENFRNNYFEI